MILTSLSTYQSEVLAKTYFVYLGDFGRRIEDLLCEVVIKIYRHIIERRLDFLKKLFITQKRYLKYDSGRLNIV